MRPATLRAPPPPPTLAGLAGRPAGSSWEAVLRLFVCDFGGKTRWAMRKLWTDSICAVFQPSSGRKEPRRRPSFPGQADVLLA